MWEYGLRKRATGGLLCTVNFRIKENIELVLVAYWCRCTVTLICNLFSKIFCCNVTPCCTYPCFGGTCCHFLRGGRVDRITTGFYPLPFSTLYLFFLMSIVLIFCPYIFLSNLSYCFVCTSVRTTASKWKLNCSEWVSECVCVCVCVWVCLCVCVWVSE